MIFTSLFLIFIGLSAGVVVGTGLVAFLSVLDIIPRLVQIIGSSKYLMLFQWTVVLGPVVFTVFDFFPVQLKLPPGILGIPGLFMGIFVGLLAAAVTEVVNVIPILTRRLNVFHYLYLFILAIALGKTLGSLFHWLVYVRP